MKKKTIICILILAIITISGSIYLKNVYNRQENLEIDYDKEIQKTYRQIKKRPDGSYSSERRNRLIDLIKEKYAEQGYLDTAKVKRFNVLKIIDSGYYKSKPNVHYYQIDLDLMCKDGSLDCFTRKNENYPEIEEEFGYNASIWVVLDNDEFVEFRDGITIWIYSDFVQTSIEVK